MIKYSAEMMGGNVAVMISEQLFYGNDFYFGNKKFISSNNFILASDDFPCNSKNDYLVYLRGKNRRKDHYCIKMSLNKFMRFKEAVEEYNESVAEC